MPEFAWVIFADGAVDQIVESADLCRRECDDLRAMGCQVWEYNVPWEQQDNAVALTIAAYRKEITRRKEKIEHIIAAHGEGVRPAFVSADIGHEEMWIRNYEERIAMMEEHNV